MEKTKNRRTKRRMGSWLRRAATLATRLTVTLAIVAGAALAVQFGASELARRAEAAPAPDAAPVIPVQTVQPAFQSGYTLQRAFVGQNEPQRTVSVSFELSGQLSTLSFDEGDTVAKGAVLATQDTALLNAERARLEASKSAAEAQLKFARQTVGRNEALTERGFTSQANLDGAVAQRDDLEAQIAAIDASIANVDIRLEKSRLIAPFDGRVTSRFVDGREALSPGQPVLELVEQSAPLVRVGVPLSFDEARLQDARIDLAGEVVPARLVTLRPDIDPVTRTRTALFAIEAETRPAFGQTARLLVTEEIEAEGLWLPMTSLKEGQRGQWTVLTVAPDEIVRAAPVEILHAESDRVFVRATLPDGTLLIDAGPQRVTVGQRVATTLAN